MKVYNSTQSNLISDKVEVADTFIKRTFGLIPKNFLSEGEGLIIKPCCSIHTFFMKFPIDVVFVDKDNKIVSAYRGVSPWRILPIHFNSFYVLELFAGTIEAKNIQIGDIIAVEKDI